MEEELRELGLTRNEIKLYTTLLKYKEISAQALARKAKIDRSVTYNLLSSLTNKGLIGSLERNNKKQFFATDPESLLIEIKIKEDIARQAIKKINQVRARKHKNDYVKVFEGQRGSKKFYNLISQIDFKEFLSIGGSGKSTDQLKLSQEYFLKQYVQSGKKLKIITGKNYTNTSIYNKLPNCEIKVTLPHLHHATCNVVNDMVIFHEYEDNEKAIIIKNKTIAALMSDVFKQLWK